MLRGIALLACLLSTGCALVDLAKTRESQQAIAEFGYVGGTLAASGIGDSWMLVLIGSFPCDEDWSALRAAVARGEDPAQSDDAKLRAALARMRQKLSLVEHVHLQRPGRWFARLTPGCYGVGAFADLNRDGRYADEPALAPLHPSRMLELAAGERIDRLELEIPRDGRFALDSIDPVAQQARDLAARSHADQAFVSIDAVAVEGRVVDLADPRFGAESGKLGFFDVFSFAWKLGPGVYFLEPYDPQKIPVLFVHGAEGYPQQFEKLIAGLDRTRYQPWFYFYPSGARLEALAHFLTEQISRLELRLGFERMAVVAHSMGGLVSRAFVLEHNERVERDSVRLLVSISTPWSGVASARSGVERSPVVIDSWRDVATDSEFLRGLYFQDPEGRRLRSLPEGVEYHLIFGVSDETIAVPSAIRWQVVREADDRWPLPYGHVEILASPEASLLLNEILMRWSE